MPRSNVAAKGSREVGNSKKLDKKVALTGAVGSRAKVIRVELNYAQRVLVPRGSELRIVVRDAKDNRIFFDNIKTKTDAPPYMLEIPFGPSATFPLKVDASLKSVIGHKFSQRFQLQRVATATPPVKVLMHLE